MLHPEFPRAALLGAMAALLVTLAPTTARADDAAMIRKSVTVNVSDLDLARPADVKTLHLRIRRAAAEACSYGFGAAGTSAAEPDRDCMALAIAGALEQIKPVHVTYEPTRTR